jgi:predicted DNA-binding antitoxin AbrB/MazE fold protein
MSQTAYAVYENGVLRLATPLVDVREGQRLVVSVQAIEELDSQEFDRRVAEKQRLMEAKGLIQHLSPPPEPPPVDWKPLVIEGEPLSETIVKMRRGE